MFNAGGEPSVTLIDRSNTPAYKAIAAQIRRRGRVISLHGESKSGKTILYKQVLADRPLVEIHATSAKTLDGLWTALREKLTMPTSYTISQGKADEKRRDSALEAGAEVGLLGGKISASASTNWSERQAEGTTETRHYASLSNDQVTSLLVERGAVIVIDDFHWIPDDVQAQILRDMRPFLLRNGLLVVVSVPERAEQILLRDHEMATLCSVVESPGWELDEITSIGRKGFDSLNLIVDDSHIRKLAGMSHRNPMLMQEACYQLCCHFGKMERQPAPRPLQITPEDIQAIFKLTAKQQDRPQYRQFIDGGAPKSWKTARGREVSIYTLCLLAMRHIGFKQEIGRDRLVERIGEIIGSSGKRPDKGTVKRALQMMANDMKKALGDNAPMEYDPQTERVFFLDPFFMTYIQWVLAPSVDEPQPT